MKDIARELGISVATGSRALKNNPAIREEIREKVQEYAASINFYPNEIAASLRSSKVSTPK